MLEELLPEWAERINTEQELIVGTQLCTKDGRRTGNARIIQVTTSKYTDEMLYVVETDKKNIINANEAEVNELFYIGKYILKEKE